MPSQSRFPIAETFTSIQGEGFYTGTPMHFIRLAGCNVGVYATHDATHSRCTTVFGTEFTCDTNYRRDRLASVEELFAEVPKGVEHICITGGEPLLHDLMPFLRRCAGIPEMDIEGAAMLAGVGHTFTPYDLHIETSGTVIIPEDLGEMAWVTCSPKHHFLPRNGMRVSEWKFVVGSVEEIEKIDRFFSEFAIRQGAPIYLQPINRVECVDAHNLAMVKEAVMRNPRYRLSLQLHKILEVR